jgi:urease accessory protein
VGLHGDGFTSGFAHPIFGFDHFLAMLSVGLLSVQMGGRAIWTVPTTFVLFVLVGGILGMHDVPLFTVEAGIASSVLILGLTILADRQIPVLLAMAGVAVFGLFHGHAHGTEMPGFAHPAAYASGFVLGTALIHLLGVGLGLIATRNRIGSISLRVAGALIAILGLSFLITAILEPKPQRTAAQIRTKPEFGKVHATC